MTESSSPWYTSGLRFGCHSCGACCRVEGHVWVDEEAVGRLAKYLGLSVGEFGERFVRRVGRRLSLVEKPNHDCVFWDDGCSVYEARPEQCRTFPFWPELLRSAETWAEVAEECRGIGGGRLYGADEVRAISSGRVATENGPAGGCGCGGE